MIEIPFTKMHGLGNDFILVEAFTSQGSNFPSATWRDDKWRELAIRSCDRHFGIGADGLIAIMSSSIADFRMRMFNPDGSEAQMCGNGIRCLARYVYDRRLTTSTQPRIETLAGIKQVQLNVIDGEVAAVTVDMGTPAFEASSIPANVETQRVKDYPLNVGGNVYAISCVSMGNPHTVTFLNKKEVDEADLAAIGPLFERHELFPERTNTEFCAVLDRRTIRMRVWERGAGQTLACGTGACAAAVVAIDHGLVDNQVKVILDGGELAVEWQGPGTNVFMTGPAEYICSGEYFYGDKNS